MMNHVVSKFEAVFVYLDDSRVGSLDKQTHLVHSEALFAALAANGPAINLEKCVSTWENAFLLFQLWKFWAT
jgi:hypothetical protein